MTIGVVAAIDRVFVRLLQARGDRALRAVTDHTFVDRTHEGDLAAGADQEDLFREVEFGARDRAFAVGNATILGELEDRLAARLEAAAESLNIIGLGLI